MCIIGKEEEEFQITF